MTKERLKQSLKNYQSICAELEDLTVRLDQCRSEEVGDIVSSSAEFPFTLHSVRVEGYAYHPERVHLEQQIQKLREDCADILEEVSKIEDSLVRLIIRYRYLQAAPLGWKEIGRRMGYHSESTARMILERYFSKN